MRVAVLHNFYSSALPSGENLVVKEEIALLRSAGVEVVEIFRNSDRLTNSGAALAALNVVSNPVTDQRLRTLLSHERPDIVHAHNLTPLLSSHSLRIARELGIATVRTMHNYRIGCIAGTHFRDGRICVECLPSRASRGVVHGCYRGSRLQSVAVTLGRALDNNMESADKILVLSDFMREYLLEQGLPVSKLVLRPNPVARIATVANARRGFLFAGRLDGTKGAEPLVRAWRPQYGQLTLVGAGPEAAAIRSLAAASANVRFFDTLPHHELIQLMSASEALLVPSLWYEGFPRVIAEAFSVGTPVVASNYGSLSSIVGPDRGWLANEWNTEFLQEVVAEVRDKSLWRSRSRACLEYYNAVLTPEVALASLLSVYGSAIACRADGTQQ